jgi:hypothetical protein
LRKAPPGRESLEAQEEHRSCDRQQGRQRE